MYEPRDHFSTDIKVSLIMLFTHRVVGNILSHHSDEIVIKVFFFPYWQPSLADWVMVVIGRSLIRILDMF